MEVLLTMNSMEARDRAEARFKIKQERAQDGAKAMMEYEAAGVALRQKAARLKALRLAKEAAELEIQVNAKLVTPSLRAHGRKRRLRATAP
jgi:hypothetical protein